MMSRLISLILALTVVVLIDHANCQGCFQDQLSSTPSELSFAFPTLTRERSRPDSPSTPSRFEPNALDRERPNRSVDWHDLKPIIAAREGLSSEISDPEMIEAMVASAESQIRQTDMDGGHLKSLVMFVALAGVCQPACLNDANAAPLYRLLDLVTGEAFVKLPNWADVLGQLCPHLTKIAQIIERDALWLASPRGRSPEPGLIALLNDRLCSNPTVFNHPVFMEFVTDLVESTFDSVDSRLLFVQNYGNFAISRPPQYPSWLSPRVVFAGLHDRDDMRALIPDLLVVMSANWQYTNHKAPFLKDLYEFSAANDLLSDILDIVAHNSWQTTCASYGLPINQCKLCIGSSALYLIGRSPDEFLNQPMTPSLIHSIIIQCEIQVGCLATIIATSMDRMELEYVASLTRLLLNDRSDLSFFDCSLFDHLLRRRSNPKHRRYLWRSALSTSNLEAMVKIYQFNIVELVEMNGITSVLYYWFPASISPPIEAHESELAVIRVLMLNNRSDLLRGPDIDRLLSDSNIDIGACPDAVLDLLLHMVDYYPELHWGLSPRITQIIQSMTYWNLADLCGKRSPVPAGNRDVLFGEGDLLDCQIDHELNQHRAGYAWKLRDHFGKLSRNAVSGRHVIVREEDVALATTSQPGGSSNGSSSGSSSSSSNHGSSRGSYSPIRHTDETEDDVPEPPPMTEHQRQRRIQFTLELIMKAIELNPGPAAAAFNRLDDDDSLQYTLLNDILGIMLDQHGVRHRSESDLVEKVLVLHSAVWLDAQRPNRLLWLKEILLALSLPTGSFSARARILFVLRQCASAFLDDHCMQIKQVVDQIPEQDLFQYPDDIQSIMYHILLLTAKHRWSKAYPSRLVRCVSWSDLVRDPVFLDLVPYLDSIVMVRLLAPIRTVAIQDEMKPDDRDALIWVLSQPLSRCVHARLEDLETVGQLLGREVQIGAWQSDTDGNDLALCCLFLHISGHIRSRAPSSSGAPWDLSQITSFIVKTVAPRLSQSSIRRLFNDRTIVSYLLCLPLNLSHGQHRSFISSMIVGMPHPADELPGWPVLLGWLCSTIQSPRAKTRRWAERQIELLKVSETVKQEILSYKTETSAAAPESPTLSRSGSQSSALG